MKTKATLKYLVILLLQCLTSATLFSQQELIRNGHFEAGNTGFFTQYFYCNTKSCLYPTGGYAVGTNPDFFNPAFLGKDHTTGTGNFMIINGSEDKLKVWKETVRVTPNTQYKFSLWISSMVTLFPAKLNIFINGVSIGKKAAPSVQNQWERFSATWNSGSSDSATIFIVDLNSTAAGNDFGLDDISFKFYSSTEAQEEFSSNKTLSVQVADTTVKLSFFPNPSTEKITVKYNTNQAERIELVIYDMSGRAIFNKTSQTIKGLNNYYLTVSHFKPGMYYLEIGSVHQRERIKFVVQ
jgi:hypothetical protein